MRVLMFGTFDGLHPGHRFVIEKGRERGEVTIVVARDRTVERLKGHAPAHGEEERRAAIESAYPDVTAVLGDPEEYLRPVIAHDPDLILLGYDQRLPPGVTQAGLRAPIERLPAYKPEKYKSSRLWKGKTGSGGFSQIGV